jgi:HPt (histidine-containing phosphotransfer) domain-containing protein
VLDMAVIERIREMQKRGASGLLPRLRRLYLENSARLVTSIEAALKAAEAEALRNAAHTLKSASGNLGAASLARSCAEIEALGRDGRIDEAAAQWLRARPLYDRVRAALAELEVEATAT